MDYTYTININTGEVASISGSSEGDWGFGEDGFGPFNSFYALFSASDGHYMGRLDPYDLARYVDGGEAPISENNVMWVLPTVYMAYGGEMYGNMLMLSNEGTEEQAFAHLIDGHLYDYIGIGVYEASAVHASGGKTAMASFSGAAPSVGVPLDDGSENDWYSYAENTPAPKVGRSDAGKSMVWNFYQWELYKYCVYVLMNGANSQAIVGRGYTGMAEGDGFLAGGTMDVSGPYCGDQTGKSGAKAFIENAWGNAGELVGGATFESNHLHLSQMSHPSAGSSDAADCEFMTEEDGYPEEFEMSFDPGEENTWGWGRHTDRGSATVGLCDWMKVSKSIEERPPVVGGTLTDGERAGISAVDADAAFSAAGGTVGSRLAFAFDADAGLMGVPEGGYAYNLVGIDESIIRSVVSGGLRLLSVTDSEGNAMEGATPSSDGSWAFDRATGYGPFNSFYALFDGQTGDMICHLDPYDLGKAVSGSEAPLKGNNVMWVVPTVYWSVDGSGDLVLSSRGEDSQAYAHYVDGRVYPYLAIGVYESSTYTRTVGGTGMTAMGSISGAEPTGSKSLVDWYSYARNTPVGSQNDGTAMVWNFYQWELYKYVSYAVMGSFDSQTAMGNGNIYSEEGKAVPNGTMDGAGPYSGRTDSMSDGFKLLIENMCGNMTELVGGATFDQEKACLSHGSEPAVGDSDGGTFAVPNDFGVPERISTSAMNWGWWECGGGTSSTGLTDVCGAEFEQDSDPQVLDVGAPYVAAEPSDEMYSTGVWGISTAIIQFRTTEAEDCYGSRMAMVFGEDSASHGLRYETMGGSEAAGGDFPEGAAVTLADAPAREGYDFGGWYADPGCAGSERYDAGAKYAMPAEDTALYAKWMPKTFEVTASIDDGGIATIKSQIVEYGGDSDQMVFVPAEGYRLAEFTIGGGEPQAVPDPERGLFEYRFVNVTSDMTIAVSTVPIEFEVTAEIVNGDASPVTQKVQYGKESAPITFTAGEGHHLVSCTVGGVPREVSGNTFTCTVGDVREDTRVCVNAAADTFAVHFEQGAFTAISDASSNDGEEVVWHSDLTFRVEAAEGCGDHLLVTNGGEVLRGDGGLYTVSGIEADVTVVTSIDAPERVLTFVSSDPSMGSVSMSRLSVPEGVPVTVTGSELMIGNAAVVAEGKGDCALYQWTGAPAVVTEDAVVTAEFRESTGADRGSGAVAAVAAVCALAVVGACGACALVRLRP